jgi:hypothetical protein
MTIPKSCTIADPDGPCIAPAYARGPVSGLPVCLRHYHAERRVKLGVKPRKPRPHPLVTIGVRVTPEVAAEIRRAGSEAVRTMLSQWAEFLRDTR